MIDVLLQRRRAVSAGAASIESIIMRFPQPNLIIRSNLSPTPLAGPYPTPSSTLPSNTTLIAQLPGPSLASSMLRNPRALHRCTVVGM